MPAAHMKFFVDENLPRIIVEWLRAGGHDVVSAAESSPGETDTAWAELAFRDQRILLTQDKDFGALIYRNGLATHGVVLLRLDEFVAAEILARFQEVWSVIEVNPTGRFIVVTETRVRVRLLPQA